LLLLKEVGSGVVLLMLSSSFSSSSLFFLLFFVHVHLVGFFVFLLLLPSLLVLPPFLALLSWWGGGRKEGEWTFHFPFTFPSSALFGTDRGMSRGGGRGGGGRKRRGGDLQTGQEVGRRLIGDGGRGRGGVSLLLLLRVLLGVVRIVLAIDIGSRGGRLCFCCCLWWPCSVICFCSGRGREIRIRGCAALFFLL